MVNFPWTVHQENVLIVGLQGSGKTTQAVKIVQKIPHTPRIIVSPINRQSWMECGEPIDSLDQLGRGAYLWTGANDAATFDKICTIIMDQIPNCVFIVDDIQEYATKYTLPRPLNTLIQSGRNRGICSIWLSPSPNLISNYILQSAQHIFAFRMNMESQIEWIERNYFGPDAYILLPPERRRKKGSIEFEGILPRHAYLYRYYMDDFNQLYVPEGAAPPPPAPEQAPAPEGSE
ncbi:MAG: hypothetical protein MPL62_04460 [Alphaproteobacteria bacterium]|nr:hypothetical protein [Alphaproteobacteria bacterium]